MKNILIRGLSEKTVKALTKQAEKNKRSFPEHVKAILKETVEYERRLRRFRRNSLRIRNELRKSGQKFPDTTALLREDRDR